MRLINAHTHSTFGLISNSLSIFSGCGLNKILNPIECNVSRVISAFMRKESTWKISHRNHILLTHGYYLCLRSNAFKSGLMETLCGQRPWISLQPQKPHFIYVRSELFVIMNIFMNFIQIPVNNLPNFISTLFHFTCSGFN